NTQPYIQATKTLLNTPYLSALTQYGSDGKAIWAGVSADMTKAAPKSFSVAGVRDEIDRVVHYAPDMWYTGDPTTTPIYVVVTKSRPSSSRWGGHSQGGYVNNPFPLQAGGRWVNMIWVSSPPDVTLGTGTIDWFSPPLSHELVESITPPPIGSRIRAT